MHTLFAVLQIAAPQDDGLTFSRLLGNIPTEPAALFVYLLLFVSLVVIYRGSRPKKAARGHRANDPS